MTFEMICTCKPEDFLSTEERRLRIFNRMRLKNKEDLTKAIVLSLAFDFQVEAHLAADMWFGVSLETPLLEDSLYIECDNPEDGLAYLWEHLADKFPERTSVSVEKRKKSEEIAALVSAVLVEQYKVAEMRWSGAPRAEDGKREDAAYWAALELFVLAEKAVRGVWGSADLDMAIEKAFGE
jgi:hypothetical protein